MNSNLLSRYHSSRLVYMAKGSSPRCETIISKAPKIQKNKITFEFDIDNKIHTLFLEWNEDLGGKWRPLYLLGIAMSEVYRLAEIITPKSIFFPWYACEHWEVKWWNEDLYWYLQQKYYLEKWDLSEIPTILFGDDSADSDIISSMSTIEANKDYAGFLLAVSGGKESTFAWHWLKRSTLRYECYTLHHSGGILGIQWESKFPIFNLIRSSSLFYEFRQHPCEDPADKFGFQGVRNDPTVTNALFQMMFVAESRCLKYLTMANDRSANEANVVYQGKEINHQSAKGSEYISRFNLFLIKKDLPFRYVSLCEGVYSLGATHQLAIWDKKSLSLISSCNEAQWSTSDNRWCCLCSKCAFSYLLIEASTSRDFAIFVVGEDLILKKDLLLTWMSLFSAGIEKPFECVGEKEETLVALGMVLQNRKIKGEALGWLDQPVNIDQINKYLKILPPSQISEEESKLFLSAL